MSSHRRVAGLTLPDRVRSSAVRERLRVGETVEVVRAPDQDASRSPSFGGVPGTTIRVKAPRPAQDELETLCVWIGLVTARGHPG